MFRSVILSASKSCFVACPGCYNYFGRSAIDTSSILTFASALRSRFAINKITVGGGDPLVRRDILDLLRGLKHLGFSINLDTVGTAFLRDATIRFMGSGTVPRVDHRAVAASVDLIGIPLDGSSDAVSQQFRRFSKVSEQHEILRLLDAVGARVCVNTVVHRGNTFDLPEIATGIGEYMSVIEWQLFQFMPIGPLGFRNRIKYEIDSDTYHRAVAAARMRLSAMASPLRVVVKSGAARKHRYLLIDSDGNLWTPQQATGDVWSGDDTNDRRLIVGNIAAEDILDRLASYATLTSAERPLSAHASLTLAALDGSAR